MAEHAAKTSGLYEGGKGAELAAQLKHACKVGVDTTQSLRNIEELLIERGAIPILKTLVDVLNILIYTRRIGAAYRYSYYCDLLDCWIDINIAEENSKEAAACDIFRKHFPKPLMSNRLLQSYNTWREKHGQKPYKI